MRKPLPLSEETAELLRHERQLEASSPEQRRRVLARARLAERMNAARPPRRSSRGAYVIGGVVGLGLGVAAYAAMDGGAGLTPGAGLTNSETRTEAPTDRRPLELEAPPDPATLAPLTLAPLPSTPLALGDGPAPRNTDIAASSVNASKTSRARALPEPNDGQAADQELALLARTKAAIAKGNYATALTTIDEHTRRFPTGRLREEREALRVTALSNSGQHDRARRAAARFAESFPRSVLSAQMATKAKAKP